MPVYEYMCKGCGPFTTMRPMSEYELPADCPACGKRAPRVMLTAPGCFSMAAETRLAHATNERSAHAPRVLSSPWSAHGAGTRSAHGAGCSCCSTSTTSRKTRRGKGGTKSFPASRPWMISH
jgi:putative FmdB family regulatory protein